MNDRTEGASVLILEVTGVANADAVASALPAALSVRVWPYGRLGDRTIRIAYGGAEDRDGAGREARRNLARLGLGVVGGRWSGAA